MKKDNIKIGTKKVANKTKGVAKKVVSKTKQAVEKTKKVYNSPKGKKVREWIKDKSKIVSSHLATIKAGITLSNDESKLLENLKSNLNKKGIYPSKSEILRAGLWSLRNMNAKQLEDSIKDLIKVKSSRLL